MVTIFIALLLGGLLGVGIGSFMADDTPQMNTICDSFHSEVKTVTSVIGGTAVPLEITEYVCDDFHMRDK